MSKQFLAVGDYLINPDLLTYAVLEQGAAEPRLRLGFATRGTDPEGELQLTGDAAREVLRWLRLNAVFLSAGGGFGAIGNQARLTSEPKTGNYPQRGNRPIVESWGPLDATLHEDAGRFLSRTGDPS